MRGAGLAGRLAPFLKVANSPFFWTNYISTCLLLCEAVRIAIVSNLRTTSRNLNRNYSLSEVFLFQIVACQIDALDSFWLILTQLRDPRSQACFLFHPESDWETLGVSVYMCGGGGQQTPPFLASGWRTENHE